MTIHLPRPDYRSNLSVTGVADVTIMAILGHSNFKTSLRYQNNRSDRQVAAFTDAFKVAMEG